MKLLHIKRYWLGLAIGIIFAWPVWASGLAVSPASYYWKNVIPGVRSVQDYYLRVMNKTESQRSYSLTVFLPNKGEKGYTPLPDQRWVILSKQSVTVPANSSVIIPVSILVPKEKRYRGQAWLFYLAVKEQVAEQQKIILACYPKIYVKTIK